MQSEEREDVIPQTPGGPGDAIVGVGEREWPLLPGGWEATLVSTSEPCRGLPQLTGGNLVVVGSPLTVWVWSQRNSVCYRYWVEGKTVAKMTNPLL